MNASLNPFYVAIGASGGEGLHDIRDLLAALPAGLPAAVLVVLHRPVDKMSHLQSILARDSKLPVVVAGKSERIEAGICYIGEPAAHLTVCRRGLADLVADLENRYRNRTVDLLFHSLAVHAGKRMIGVVLSGSLDDGSRGLAAMKEAGGTTMVLDRIIKSPKGMPENALAHDGPIDFSGGAKQIGEEIVRLVHLGIGKH